MGLASLFVCSMPRPICSPVRASNSKTKRRRKPKTGVNVPHCAKYISATPECTVYSVVYSHYVSVEILIVVTCST